jgi:predicted lipoprotein with Yx(FWY)xxD motif
MFEWVLTSLIATVLVLSGVGDDVGARQSSASGDPTTPVKVVGSPFGRVVADRQGEAFYLFDSDRTGESRCYGTCAKVWPPVLAKGRLIALKGARTELLGTTMRNNGKRQLTYAGSPMYYYRHDSPGSILCHDVEEFGGLWLVLRPSGQPA